MGPPEPPGSMNWDTPSEKEVARWSARMSEAVKLAARVERGLEVGRPGRPDVELTTMTQAAALCQYVFNTSEKGQADIQFREFRLLLKWVLDKAETALPGWEQARNKKDPVQLAVEAKQLTEALWAELKDKKGEQDTQGG